VVAVAVAASLVAWLALRPQRGSRFPEQATAPDHAATLTAQAAYDTAVRLSEIGRHEESLPYYRRAVTGTPENPWVVHFNYSNQLYNMGFQLRRRHGVSVPVVRSSIERVALMREALAELDIAERLTTTARDRAMVLRARAERFQVWGFPWEGFVQLREAQWADPQRKELGGAADGYMLVLEHPERRWTAGADTVAPP
jgi:tetratricopeptide (TPR) repeat protein